MKKIIQVICYIAVFAIISGCSMTMAPTSTKPEITESEYKASCVEMDYSDLLRDPEAHKGERYRVVLKITQVVDDMFRCYTDDGTGWWIENEFVVEDKRIDGGSKFIKDDIIEVWATYQGNQTVTRAFGNNREEVPHLVVYWGNVVDEDSVEIDGAPTETLKYELNLLEARVSEDWEDAYALAVCFKFTNNSSETISYFLSSTAKVFQNGVQLESTYFVDDWFESDNNYKELKPGASVSVWEAFLLDDTTTPVEIEVIEAFAFGTKDIVLFETVVELEL